MLVPKTTVNEDDFSSSGKHQIGSAGQVSAMKAIPVTHSVDEEANFHFWSSIDITDARHDAAAKFRGDSIRHYRFTQLISKRAGGWPVRHKLLILD